MTKNLFSMVRWKMKKPMTTISRALGVCLTLVLAHSSAITEIDPKTGRFYFRDNNNFPDDTLGHIALYLVQQNRKEGNAYVSQSVAEGIVEYQIRFFDNGNAQLVDEEDLLTVRRYTTKPPEPEPQVDPNAPPIPAPGPPADEAVTEPPPPPPKPDVVGTRYIEYVDLGLNGLDERDYYFLDGRRFDLASSDIKSILEYRSQVATAVNVFIEKIDYEAIVEGLGSTGKTGIRKRGAFDDGSLPSLMVFGLDLPYVFKPSAESGGQQQSEEAMLEEIRQRVGFVYSATVGYTDLNGFRFRDIADQTPLLQRHYDQLEQPLLRLIMDSLFDPDGDELVTQENISNGYTRFRELHQQLSDNARGAGRRVLLPNEKLAKLRLEHEKVHQRPFSP